MTAGDGRNPAQFSDSIIEWLRDNLPDIVPDGYMVFDPFAGSGMKLGKLCDELGYWFVGNELEKWADMDSGVRIADSTLARNYPQTTPHDGERPFIIVTSPTYNNGVNDHFDPRDGTRRLTYRNSLGHELHPHNTGRYSGRGSKKNEQEYWRLHEQCVRHWPDVVVVNVKDSTRAGKMYPLGAKWMAMLKRHGYTITTHKVGVSGWRYGENSNARSEFEWILVAARTGN